MKESFYRSKTRIGGILTPVSLNPVRIDRLERD
jgi:hypothetical protein